MNSSDPNFNVVFFVFSLVLGFIVTVLFIYASKNVQPQNLFAITGIAYGIIVAMIPFAAQLFLNFVEARISYVNQNLKRIDKLEVKVTALINSVRILNESSERNDNCSIQFREAITRLDARMEVIDLTHTVDELKSDISDIKSLIEND